MLEAFLHITFVRWDDRAYQKIATTQSNMKGMEFFGHDLDFGICASR
jgi:hypothetical protein